MLAGAATIGRNGDLRVIVGLFTAQTLVAGALAVLLVVVAIQLLATGNAGVGWLDASVGRRRGDRDDGRGQPRRAQAPDPCRSSSGSCSGVRRSC